MTVRSKALNDLLARLDRSYLSARSLAYPSKYYVAVCSVCDIRCPYCPRQYFKSDVDAGVMSLEDFRGLAPWLKYSNYTGLFGLGEPFLHKRFLEFIQLTKQAGAYAATSSHGMSLTPRNIDELIGLELDELELSIDAPSRRLFEFLRCGARFDEVMRAARHLRSRKTVLRRDKPKVHVASAISRHNVRSMPALVRLAKDIGAARIVFTDLIIVDPNNKDLSVAGTAVMGRNLKKAAAEARRWGIEMLYFRQNPFPWRDARPPGQSGIVDRRAHPSEPILDCTPPIVEARDERFGCPEAWGGLIVERDGRCKPCCYIGEIMGNAFEAPPEAIENGERKTMLKRALTRGQLTAPCRDCCNLVRVTPEYVANVLEEVASAAAETPLAPPEREEIEERLGEYRRLFTEREGLSPFTAATARAAPPPA